MRPLRQLAGDTVLYGLSSVGSRVLSYLLVPFYTSIFLPADYGLLTEWYAYAALLQILYAYGMETTYFRFARQGTEAFDLAVSVLLVSSLAFSSLLIFFATPITVSIAHPGYEHYVYYLTAILTVDVVLTIPLAQLRLQNRALHFARIKCLQVGLNIALNLVLLYGCANIYAGNWLIKLQPLVTSFYNPARKIEYIFFANLVANMSAFLLLGKSLRKVKFQLPWLQLKPMLAYAWPLLLMGLAGTVNEMLSRAMLRHWLPLDFYPGQSHETTLGIFGACYKLAVVMPLSIQAFRYAAEPFFFAHAQKYNAPILFSAVMHWFVLGACFILFSIGANLDLLGSLLLRKVEYRAALEIVPYLMLGYLFLGMYYNLSIWFKLIDKTHYGIWLTGIGALINLVLNVVLIPILGYWGSVWATVTSYAIMCLLCYYWGQKYYPIPYRLGRKLTYVMFTMGCVFLVRRVVYTNGMVAVMGNLVLTFLFGILIYKLGYKKKRPIDKVATIFVALFQKNNRMRVHIINRSKHALPTYATADASGMDLRANIDKCITLQPFQRVLVGTGLYIALPKGYEAQVRPRSGLAFKHGLTVLNSPGTIDADYRGEIKVMLINLAQEDFVIEDGERIAQLVIAAHAQATWAPVATLDNTSRGQGGFGSTGTQ